MYCVCMFLNAGKVQEIEGELKRRLFGKEDCSECSCWKNGAQNVPVCNNTYPFRKAYVVRTVSFNFLSLDLLGYFLRRESLL